MIQFGDDITITDPPLGSGGGEYTRAINICTYILRASGPQAS